MFKKITFLIVLTFSIFSFSQDVVITNGTINTCTGVFTDSGGSSGNYAGGEDFTFTICADVAGDAVTVDFTNYLFATQDGIDILSIFDGPDDSAPLLGNFTGDSPDDNPGLIEPSQSNVSGCLTFVWTNNNTGNAAGWEADITCFTPCQNIVANVDSTVPVATAANVVVADENETITFNGSGTFSNDGTGATYLWDFGDGNTAMGTSVTHAYTSAGLFVVTLTITDTNGCTNTNTINLTSQIGSTAPGNPFVDAGADVDIPCEETCTTLTANFLDIGDTSTYNVNSIPFVPPFSFQGLMNSVNTNVDDRWGDVEDLPFDLCFFNDIETQFQVGSNGVIRFDVDPGDISNDFNPNNIPLPSDADDALSEPNVFTPLHDIDPSVGDGSDEIAWEIIGTPPNRVLAVSFYNVPMWSCNSELATHMAVFYETTNVIDIYVENAPFCSSWNNNKVIGIQNDAGTEAFVPPGRNTNEGGGWTTSNEAWRFTPAGPSIVDFAWLDASGNVLSTDVNFQVCPTDPSTTYTAQVTYTNCNGDTVVVTDDVVVTTNSPFTVDLGPDVNQCEGDPDVILDATTAGAASYQWQLDGSDLAGETNPTLTVSSPNSGTYLVTVTDAAGCIDTDEVIINYSENPIANPVTDQVVCDDDNDGFWAFDLDALDPTVIGAQTDVIVTYHNSQVDADNGDNALTSPYTNMTAFTAETIYIRIENIINPDCDDTGEFDINVLLGDDASFTMTPTCDGGTATVTGLLGGTFAFNPVPTDGAVIDTASGEVTNGVSGTTYTVEYTTNGSCPTSSTQDVTVLEQPVLSTTLDTTICTDEVSGVVLDVESGSIAAATYDIIAINTNGLVASAGAPAVGTGFGANEISDDAYTNTTAAPVVVTYTIVPVSADGCSGDPFDVNITISPEPVLSTTLDATVCSDDASGVVLDVEPGSVAAATYDITAINTNGLVASAGTPAVGTGFGANEISDDAYTNTTGAPVVVTYTIVPVSADGCSGNPFDVNITISPEPVLSTTLDATVCSDDASGVVLDVEPGSVAAATYDITAINTNGLVASAGAPVVGTGFGANEISDDAYTNTTAAPVVVTYTIVPVSADGCSGDPFDVNITINPEPVLSTTLDTTICTDEVSGVVLDVESGSIAAATYDITAINTNGLVASAGAPAVGTGFGANEISDDAYTNTTAAPVVVTYTIVPVSADGCSGDPFDVNITISPEPVLSTTLDATVCSDDASGVVLDVEPGSVVAATYDITAINTNGLVASAGAPAVGTGFGANEISDDAYTNTTGAPVVVTYTIVPVSADGCSGNPFDVNITISPEPVLSTTLDATVCSDDASGVVLDVEPGSVAAATYDITAINTNGLVASAGAPVVGTGFGANEISDDAYTNTTAAPVVVTYTIVPVSADGCSGDPFDVNITINPEPVLSTTLDTTICTDEVSGVVLDVESGSIAAATYDITAINTNGLVASAGAPAVGTGFGANEISDDAYTNTTAAPVVVTYTIVPVSADGCSGDPFDVNITISPEPVLSTTLDATVCSDDASGVVLDVEPGSVVAATYDITAINTNGLVASAGTPAVGTGFGANEISDDAYTNTTGAPVVVTHTIVPVSADGCSGNPFEVNVTVDPEPTPNYTNPTNGNPHEIRVCDDDPTQDMVELFDLTQLEGDIIPTGSGYNVVYFRTEQDAIDRVNGIPDPMNYPNVDPVETIYVRVENAFDCFVIVEIEIEVFALPDASVDVTDWLVCENDTDFVFDFELNSKIPEILGPNQSEADFEVTFYSTQDAADNEDPTFLLDGNSHENVGNPQPIFVVITNRTTGCRISEQSFNIEVQDGADANDDFYEECDITNENDGSTQFDLESRIPIILGPGQTLADFSVDFYADFDDADAGNTNILPLLYENITNPQVIYARVSNRLSPEECFDIAEVTLQVNLLPIFDLEDEYILCLTSNSEAVVDVPPVLDTELSDTEYDFEWSYNGDVLASETSSSLIPTQGGTYSVVVTNSTTGCFETDTAEVIESGIPDTFDVEVTSMAFNGNNMIVAAATGNSTYEYSLDQGPYQLSGEFENVTGGDHVVYVRDVNGCGVLSRLVTVIDYAKFFTPNGDGNNDTWQIKGIDSQADAVIYIHDRYGKLLKQLSPTSPGWDGTYNGNRMPTSDYWFVLEYREPTTNERKTFRAHFALKR